MVYGASAFDSRAGSYGAYRGRGIVTVAASGLAFSALNVRLFGRMQAAQPAKPDISQRRRHFNLPDVVFSSSKDSPGKVTFGMLLTWIWKNRLARMPFLLFPMLSEPASPKRMSTCMTPSIAAPATTARGVLTAKETAPPATAARAGQASTAA